MFVLSQGVILAKKKIPRPHQYVCVCIHFASQIHIAALFILKRSFSVNTFYPKPMSVLYYSVTRTMVLKELVLGAVARVAITKYHRLDGLGNTYLFSYSSGGQRS